MGQTKNSNSIFALKSKDLITIGIFNAVAIILYISVGVATIPVPFLHLFCVQPIAAILNGSVFSLLAAKVGKRGVFFISGILQGIIFSLLMGLYASMIICPIVGLLADAICYDFKSRFRLVTAYSLFMLGLYYGQLFFFLFFTDWFLSLFQGNALEHKQLAANSITGNIAVIMTILILVTGYIGGFIGIKMLKKHFIKAGVI